jgi:hypothetical protein
MLQPIISRDRILLPFEGEVRAIWPQAKHLEHEGRQPGQADPNPLRDKELGTPVC